MEYYRGELTWALKRLEEANAAAGMRRINRDRGYEYGAGSIIHLPHMWGYDSPGSRHARPLSRRPRGNPDPQ